MKKIVAMILILTLLLSAAAMADTNDSVDEYYAYAHASVAKDGSPIMMIIYFAKDQTCYYVAQAFHHDSAGIGRAYVGTWGYTADGYIFAKIGDNTSLKLKPSVLGSLVDTETMSVYEPFSVLMD